MSQYTQGISLYLTNAQYRSQSRPCFRLHACSSRRSRCTAAAPAHHALQGSDHNIVPDGHVTSGDKVLFFPRTNLAPSTNLVVLADAKGQRPHRGFSGQPRVERAGDKQGLCGQEHAQEHAQQSGEVAVKPLLRAH